MPAGGTCPEPEFAAGQPGYCGYRLYRLSSAFVSLPVIAGESVRPRPHDRSPLPTRRGILPDYHRSRSDQRTSRGRVSQTGRRRATGNGSKTMATPVKWGNEFLVNTNTANDQNVPAITGLADGRFVVMWDGRQPHAERHFGRGSRPDLQCRRQQGRRGIPRQQHEGRGADLSQGRCAPGWGIRRRVGERQRRPIGHLRAGLQTGRVEIGCGDSCQHDPVRLSELS